jgi:hypothetical protein
MDNDSLGPQLGLYRLRTGKSCIFKCSLCIRARVKFRQPLAASAASPSEQRVLFWTIPCLRPQV